MPEKRFPRRMATVTPLVRLQLLPLTARGFVLLLLSLASFPPVSVIYAQLAAPQSTSLLATAGRLPALTTALSVAVLLAALLILERPRTPSPRDYLQQLRTRLQQVQSHYDAALRRLLQEQNDEHHVPVRRDP